ncbi:chorion protein S19 [Drosophila eugracilis]|uniref:chorion protein S19 n=1 Tax=Drosophila eugracilis TaxID=29029 RepID=UPI001BD939CE|nr:chorion protein S19 [Drosophila eugracilis]
MNKFTTLAVIFCACIVGSCYANYGGPQSYGPRSYGQDSSAASAASSAAAAGNEGQQRYERPVEIIAGGPRGGYGPEILRPIQISGGYGGERRGYGNGGNYRRGGYGPRWTVQPAGATLLYPGQNNYKAYVSPPEYSKVILPIRPAAPVAKLFIPENQYGNQYGSQYGGQRSSGY